MITVIANLKGGSGKSTVAFNLGVWLQLKGQPTVAYDLDPQKTLADVAQVRREEGFAPPVHVYNGDGNLTKNLQYHPGEVIVDVGAANMSAMEEALRASDRIVIPVPPSQADVWATQRFLGFINKSMTKKNQPELIVFLNRADTNPAVRESDETLSALEQLPNIRLLKQRLCQRKIYRSAFSEGIAVCEQWGRSKAALEFDEFASALYPNYDRVENQK